MLRLAICAGDRVLLSLADPCELTQTLGPFPAGSVNCVSWTASGDALAVGVGATARVYERTRDGGAGSSWRWEETAVLTPTTGGGRRSSSSGDPLPAVEAGELAALAWSGVFGARRALWGAAAHVLMLWTQPADAGAAADASEWQLAWRRQLATPVSLLAGCGGAAALLASAGDGDRLAKVWHPEPPDDQAATGRLPRRRAAAPPPLRLGFSYLCHPAPVASLEWRPAPAAGAGDPSSPETSVLLSLCRDGTPRRWVDQGCETASLHSPPL